MCSTAIAAMTWHPTPSRAEGLMKTLLKSNKTNSTLRFEDIVYEHLDRFHYRECSGTFKTEQLYDYDHDEEEEDPRDMIERFFLEGNVQKAIQLIADAKPQLFYYDTEMHSLLLKQQFVEFLRKKDVASALTFAEEKLRDEAVDDPETLNDLERICSLMAFENPEDCQFTDYMNHSQRPRTIAAVNNAWTQSETGKRDSDLSITAKFVTWAQSKLERANQLCPTLDEFIHDCVFGVINSASL